jgi:hypothetical protein
VPSSSRGALRAPVLFGRAGRIHLQLPSVGEANHWPTVGSNGVEAEEARTNRHAEAQRAQRVSEVERFEFRFVPAYRRVARVFGVTPRTAWVDVHDDVLEARFGPWHVRTDLSNVANVELTGPYAFLKTAGPARLAVSDRGLTFATNGDGGALVTFRVPVPGIEPLGVLRHPELTVTVADVDSFATLLRARIATSHAD